MHSDAITATHPSGLEVLIDRLAVLPDYRHQHISSYSMEHVFLDIQNTAARNNMSVNRILALVPLEQQPWMESKLEARGFRTVDKTVKCIRAAVSYYHAVLTLS